MKCSKKFLLCCLVIFSFKCSSSDDRNLLLNPDFNFHCYENHRSGQAASFHADYVPCWNASGPKVLKVYRDSHIDAKIRPPEAAANGVKLLPGAVFHQFATLPELDLIPGDSISFSAYIHQEKAHAVTAVLQLMKLDSEDGSWCPAKDFGYQDKRVFPRHARGKLIPVNARTASSENTGLQKLKIENFPIRGHFTPGRKSYSKDMNTLGLQLEFQNKSDKPVWLFPPSLVRGKEARKAVGVLRPMPQFYRHIPRTMQKLWKGEPLHIIVMGSSIDRGSANPPIYPYNEDPASPDFKKPLCDAYDGKFSTAMLGHPELDSHLAQPRHFYSYCGQLKLELMKKFNYPADKILLNFMACDGSCIGESHSGLRDWCELRRPPSPNVNGHKSGKSWQDLYPALFARPEGPRPDLIIYGSGANEKTDTPEEAAVFEGAIRFIQRNYPGTEFIFSVFQNYGGYTPNSGDLQALALRYGIPYLDYGIIGDRICRNANHRAVIDYGHPETAVHYIWFKQLEKAFEAADPILAGFPQQHLPERAHINTLNWEGEMILYKHPSPRFYQKRLFMLDDAAFNLWAAHSYAANNDQTGALFVDGRKMLKNHYPMRYIDPRNSFFRHGNLSLGDRHLVELTGKDPQFPAIDSKNALNRRWIGVESGHWKLTDQKPPALQIHPYESIMGYPCGTHMLELRPGQTAVIRTAGNFFSVAWADMKDGGILQVALDGNRQWQAPTDLPYSLQTGEKIFIENRKALPANAYGVHEISVQALGRPVHLLGLFSYDTRSNRKHERVVRNFVQAGETVIFQPPFKAVPLIMGVKAREVSRFQAVFAEEGIFQAIGE